MNIDKFYSDYFNSPTNNQPKQERKEPDIVPLFLNWLDSVFNPEYIDVYYSVKSVAKYVTEKIYYKGKEIVPTVFSPVIERIDYKQDKLIKQKDSMKDVYIKYTKHLEKYYIDVNNQMLSIDEITSDMFMDESSINCLSIKTTDLEFLKGLFVLTFKGIFPMPSYEDLMTIFKSIKG